MDDNVNGTLLVLGNGFDLNCGLLSSFSSFFGTVDKFENIWYLLFSFAFTNDYHYDKKPLVNKIKDNDILWFDVEDFIKRILVMHREDKNHKNELLSNFKFPNYCDILKLAFEKRLSPDYFSNYLQFNHLKIFFRDKFPNLNSRETGIDILDFLNKQLGEFEEKFRKYIKNISEENEDYKTKTSKLFKLLNTGEEAYDILTFNYTSPNKAAVDLYSYGNIYHIHGSVNDSIIIGYDSSDSGNSFGNEIFLSKSYKKMFYNIENKKLPLKNQILSIKIYGHSLGAQDYSYFHVLFDYYDIFNNLEIQWIFYYTPYETTAEKNEAIKRNYLLSIHRLLNDYSIKAGYADKANVLVDKLVLENRIFIKPIEKLY